MYFILIEEEEDMCVFFSNNYIYNFFFKYMIYKDYENSQRRSK